MTMIRRIFPALLGLTACPSDGVTTSAGPELTGSTAAESTGSTGSTTLTGSTGDPTTGPAASTSTTTGAPSTTGAAEPICGDGVVDDGEECDDGKANANTAACTLACEHAVCGDGLVWADGGEQCDYGLGNSTAYNGCHPETCALGPRCGDGVQDAQHGEICDRGALNGTGVTTDELAPCDLNCGFQGRILLITSGAWKGDLGGLSGADLKCRVAALDAGLPNATKYRAWLSDGVNSPASRLSHWDSTVPLMLVGGLVVADDIAELVDFGPRRGISRTESGALLVNADAWTNTSAFGDVFSPTDHCDDWLSTSFEFAARVGRNALALEQGPEWEAWRNQRWWTTYASLPCDQFAHLYCIDDGDIPEPQR